MFSGPTFSLQVAMNHNKRHAKDRFAEVGLLKIDDVDLERRRIKIWRLKGSISGEYPLFSDTARLLKAYLKERGNDFHSPLFLSKQERAISPRMLKVLFHDYAQKTDGIHTSSSIRSWCICSMPATHKKKPNTRLAINAFPAQMFMQSDPVEVLLAGTL